MSSAMAAKLSRFSAMEWMMKVQEVLLRAIGHVLIKAGILTN